MSTKRKAPSSADSSEGTKKQAPRQDPVSCQTCRKKKLKCDRQQPCSNCLSRRLACMYAGSSTSASQNAHTPFTNASPAITSNKNSDNVVTSPLAHRNTSTQLAITSEAVKVSDTSEEDHRQSQDVIEHERTASWLEKIMISPRIPDALPASMKKKVLATNLTAFLPREAEAFMLFKYYVDYISFLYHIVIPSRVHSQINAIYQSVHDGQPSSSGAATVDLNHLALLFSILAAASYFQNLGQAVNNTAYTSLAEKRCREYTTLVAAALNQSDYVNYPTIEGLQAALVVSQLLPLAGQDSSVRAYFHQGALVNTCRSMGLFELDSVRNKDFRKKRGYDPVELEVKRRLVWSVISTDWLLSYLGGPQEGSYLIHPAHIAVDYPANIPDEDIGKPGCTESLPENIPTTMSYFIVRLKLSEFCREVTDYTCRERLHETDVPYSKIMELDRKWHQYYAGVPEFFRMDSVNRNKYAPLYKDSPQFAWQRLMSQQGYHTRLARLHRSYFIRGAREPSYSYSHIVCLNSARRVIEMKRLMDAEYPTTPSISLSWTIIHHEFMAAVVLLMDFCFNRDDILAERRKEEVIEACRMLDKAQRGSKYVREGINALMDVLRGHWVPVTVMPPSSSHSQQQQNATSFETHEIESGASGQKRIEGVPPPPPPTTTSAPYPLSSSLDAVSEAPFSDTSGATDGTLDLENLWSEFLDNSAMMASDPDDWMGLLSDLNEIAPSLPGTDFTYC